MAKATAKESELQNAILDKERKINLYRLVLRSIKRFQEQKSKKGELQQLADLEQELLNL